MRLLSHHLVHGKSFEIEIEKHQRHRQSQEKPDIVDFERVQSREFERKLKEHKFTDEQIDEILKVVL